MDTDLGLSQTELDELEAAYQYQASKDLMVFLKGLIIAGQTGPAMFDNVMAPFQREAFEACAPSIHALRDGKQPPLQRFWWERTKKAGKDSDLAAVILWLLAFPTKPLYLQIGAADKDQAAIVKRRLESLLYYNDWLNQRVEIQKWKVVSRVCGESGAPLAVLDIMAADIGGSHGETPDLLVVNELSHIEKWEFVENLISNAAGVAWGIIMIATNAGFQGTKAAVWRDIAKDKDWRQDIWSIPAPWHRPGAVEGERKMNTPSRFKRLWYGKWASGKGDALSEEDIAACFPPERMPTTVPEPGWLYTIGLDLGISHDHAGGVVLGIHIPRQMLRVALYRAWEPSARTGEVDLLAVEDWVRQMWRHYNAMRIGYDPHQAVYMAQRLRRIGAPMEEVSFQGGKNLTAMATSLITTIESHKLEAYDDPDQRLRKDLGKMNIVEKPYGYKLEAVSDETGHADVGTALVICLPHALSVLAGMVGLQAGDDISIDRKSYEEDFTVADVAAMPEDLKAIYNMDMRDIFNSGRVLARDSVYGD